MRVALVQLVTSGDMSGDVTSSPQQLDQAIAYGIQAVFTTSGTLGGTFKLQSSINYQNVPYGAPVTGNWDDISSSSVTIAAAGSYTWSYNLPPGFRWVRLVYTHLGGDTGTLNAYFFERAM